MFLNNKNGLIVKISIFFGALFFMLLIGCFLYRYFEDNKTIEETTKEGQVEVQVSETSKSIIVPSVGTEKPKTESPIPEGLKGPSPLPSPPPPPHKSK